MAGQKDKPDWTNDKLDALPVRGGFRMRGMEMTRIEAFTDAAFAFAVTLAVISIDNIPMTYADLIGTLQGIPAFAMAFAILALFWSGHWQWSRRFGLEDAPSILISLGLIFLILCYVYPLKFLSMTCMHWLGVRRFAEGEAPLASGQQLYSIFAIYGTGFVLMCGMIVLLNLHAWRLRDRLLLNAPERGHTKGEIGAWTIVGAVGLLSVAIALFTPPTALALPGWVYMLLPIIMPLYGRWAARHL